MSQRRVRVVLAVAATLSAGACHAPKATCASAPVVAPDGLCTARYLQSVRGDRDATTQALIDCTIDGHPLGGNIVALASVEHGIGLRWVDAHTLNVSVPAGAELAGQEMTGYYNGHLVVYRYRVLLRGDVAFAGCGVGR